MSSYEFPAETGEQRLQRALDRRRVWTWRALMAAGIAGGSVWLWMDGVFEEEGWDLLWMLPLCLLLLLIWEGVFEGIGAILRALFSPLARPFSSRGYSYYDDEIQDPPPDYSMAEVIVPDARQPHKGSR